MPKKLNCQLEKNKKKEACKKITLYHGTIKPFGNSIEKEGLKPSSKTGMASKWDFKNYPKNKIFATNSFGHAVVYGKLAGDSTGFKKANINIFEVEATMQDLEPEYDKPTHKFYPTKTAKEALKEWNAVQTSTPPKIKKVCEFSPKEISDFENMDYEIYNGRFFDRPASLVKQMGATEEMKKDLNKKLKKQLCGW